MDVGVDTGIFADAIHLSATREAERVLDLFERGLRRFGASHILLTGLPLPRRSVTKLILRIVWPDVRTAGHPTERGRVGPQTPPPAHGRPAPISDLLASVGDDRSSVVAVPIHDLRPYQGCVVIAGSDLPTSPAALAGLEFYCLAAFRALNNA